MDNMNDIMKTQRAFEDAPIVSSADQQKNSEAFEAIQRTTGIPINSINAYNGGGVTFNSQAPDLIVRVPTKEEHQNAEKIDVDNELIKARHDKITTALEDKNNDMCSLIGDAVNEEAARTERLTEALNDPEEVKKLKNPDEVAYESIPRATTKTNTDLYDMDELVPNYGADSSDHETDTIKPTVNINDEESSEDIDSPKYYKSLEHTTSDVDFSIAKKIRDKKIVTVSSNRYKNPKTIGDQAFLNSVRSFKRDNFGIVSIPLVNSGFSVDMVGTGVVDLKQLYSSVTEDMTMMDYNIEQMRVMIRNVVNTNPKIDPNDLRNMIHYQDFQLMAFAHVCATLDKVQMVANCSDCGKPFRIEAVPTSMILNMNELKERMDSIISGPSIEANSLLSSNRKFNTDDGFEITLGHPSYADIIKLYADIKEYSSHMTPIEKKMFIDGSEDFTMIRSIKMPNDVKTSNVFQIYIAMKLLRSEDQSIISKMVEELRSQIVIPKFGIQQVTCPHCGKVNTNIEYESLVELVFYNTQISDLLNAPEA